MPPLAALDAALLRPTPWPGVARLPRALTEFLYFGVKEARACLFAGLFFAAIFLVPRAGVLGLPRYDVLLLIALAIQAFMVWSKLETLDELKAISLFHVVGFALEVYKTSPQIGSWSYPDFAYTKLFGVPLFSGFMYACVGSYMARIQRIFDIRFVRYPPVWATVLLALAIYVNFFSHHFIYDFRWLLFATTAILYARSFMHYRVFRFRHAMPMLLAFLLVALFIWIAENIGTWSRAWIYPDQADGWAMVSWSKLGSWYLLMLISVVLVTLVHPPRAHEPGQ